MATPPLTLTPAQIIELENDAVRICQELIRFPSVNYGEGKGDEKAIAEYVAAQLAEVGIATEIIETAPNRCNVVAKIIGTSPERPGLVLHGHIDVVPAEAADWSVDPFSGVIRDGMIWGRGAVDMKDMDAMILAIVRLWARIGYQPARTMVVVFFGDEEAGGIYGSRWLAKNRPEIFAGCSEAVSEVGGFSVTLSSGHRLYLIQTAEKGIDWMKLTAHGTAGHGSLVNNDNAVTTLAEAVAKVGSYSWPERHTKTNGILFRKIAELTGTTFDPADVRPLLAHIGKYAKLLGATLQNSANPTMLSAGYKANVIPQVATAVIDGRFLPGFESELRETIQKLVGPKVTVESMTRDIALEVDFAGPLVEAMCNALASEDPEGIPVPYLMPGGTDNKALAHLGIVGYGFSPLNLTPDLDFSALFHGVDERVPVDALKFGARTLHHFLINA